MDLLLVPLIIDAIKISALAAPLVGLPVIIRLLHSTQPTLCRWLDPLCGVSSGILFFGAALLTRMGVPVVAALDGGQSPKLHLPFPTAARLADPTTVMSDQAGLSQFWHDQYISFWSEIVNPLRYPLRAAVAAIDRAPHSRGIILFAILGLLGLTSFSIGSLKNGSGGRQLLAIVLSAALGWYAAAVCLWTGAFLGTALLCGAVLAYFACPEDNRASEHSEHHANKSA
jgi:hypothetical protein